MAIFPENTLGDSRLEGDEDAASHVGPVRRGSPCRLDNKNTRQQGQHCQCGYTYIFGNLTPLLKGFFCFVLCYKILYIF